MSLSTPPLSRSSATGSKHTLLTSILSRAQDGFQYLFRSYPMVAAYLKGEDPDLFLHYVFEWLNDSRTLEVLRRITGIDTLVKVNAQATLYRPGHFLTGHDDSGLPRAAPPSRLRAVHDARLARGVGRSTAVSR